MKGLYNVKYVNRLFLRKSRKGGNMKKIISMLLLLLLIASPFAAQSFTTNVDDYTNSKGGTASKSYNFVLDGSTMNAVGSNTSSTNMT